MSGDMIEETIGEEDEAEGEAILEGEMEDGHHQGDRGHHLGDETHLRPEPEISMFRVGEDGGMEDRDNVLDQTHVLNQDLLLVSQLGIGQGLEIDLTVEGGILVDGKLDLLDDLHHQAGRDPDQHHHLEEDVGIHPLLYPDPDHEPLPESPTESPILTLAHQVEKVV